MARRFLALTVGLVVLLVGCSGLPPSTPSTPSATPAPVPADLPPGLTEAGVADPSALVSAHEAVLAETAHRTTVTEVRRHPDGSIAGRFDADRRVDPDRSRSHTVYTITGGIPGLGHLPNGSRLEIYREGDRVYGIESNATTTRYFQATENLPQAGDPLTDPLVTVFAAIEVRVQGPETRNGTTLYRLDAVRVTQPALLDEGLVNRPADAVEDVSVAAVVDEHGLIHEYRLGYTVRRERSTSHVSRTVRYRIGDGLTVTEPPWYDSARANTTPP